MLEILIFAALTGFFILKLNSVLGKRTGLEKKPFDIFTSDVEKESNDTITTLPDSHVQRLNKHNTIKEQYKNQPFASVLDKIETLDPQFNLHNFIEGAKMAFTMIIQAYNDNDQSTLKKLLSPGLFKSFVESLNKLNNTEKNITELLSFLEANVVNAALKDSKVANLTMRFITEQREVQRGVQREVQGGVQGEIKKSQSEDAENSIAKTLEKVIVGNSAKNSAKIEKVEDVWTFSRNLLSKDPNWLLVATNNHH